MKKLITITLGFLIGITSISAQSWCGSVEHRQELISQLLSFETRLHQFNAKNQQYELLIEKYKSEIMLLPEKQTYLGKLEREKNVLTNTYAYIRQKMEEARVSMASEPGKVRIINKAIQASKPVSPDIPRAMIMSIIFGGLLGFIIKMIIEYFDNSVRSLEYIKRKNLPILAVIPSIEDIINNQSSTKRIKNIISKFNNNRKKTENFHRRLITNEDPSSPISEAYRSLRTSLIYTKNGSQGSIMVSSPGPGEGKTTTIVNLAITYANLGKKIILIDADLRRPVLQNIFSIKKDLGLTHYLSGVESNVESIIQNTEITNLDIINNGAIPPNPSELLDSELMHTMVNKLKQRYDVILFDAPPIMAVTDAVVLSRLINQFILVVRFGSTDKDSIEQSLNSLYHVNTQLSGVVMNDLNQKNSYYSKNYYSDNNYYYSTGNQS